MAGGGADVGAGFCDFVCRGFCTSSSVACPCHKGGTWRRRQQQQQQQPVGLPEPHAQRPPLPGQAEGRASAHASRRPRRVLPPAFLCPPPV